MKKNPITLVYLYYSQIFKFLVLGRKPRSEDEVTVWAICQMFFLCHRVCHPDGSTYFQRSLRDLKHPWLGALYLNRYANAFALLWYPIGTAGLSLGHGKNFLEQWRISMLRPDLRILFPFRRFETEEASKTRPDVVILFYTYFEYATLKPKYQHLDDKNEFISAARQAGYPTPKTYTREEAAKVSGKLIVKHPNIDVGLGVRLLPASEIDSLPRDVQWQFSEVLENHDVIKALLPENAPLSTFRVITTLDETSLKPIVTQCALKLGRSGGVVDNLAAGGIISKYNLETGILEPAADKNIIAKNTKSERYSRHPEGGMELSQAKIPQINDILEICIKIHNEITPEALSVGWDVALTPTGPKFIELNFHSASLMYDDETDAFRPIVRLVLQRLQDK